MVQQPFPGSSEYLSMWPESRRLRMAIEERRRGINYTMPGVKTDKILNVPISDETKRCYNEHFCRVDRELNIQGLRELISSSHLEVALNGTTTLLTQMGQGEGKAGKPSTITPFHIELWGIRFQLLMALKLYPQLMEELLPFDELDAPDLYFQYYNENGGRAGSLVQFSTRLIHAEILRFSSLPWKSIERIKRLKSDVQQVIAFLQSSEATEEQINAWSSRLSAVEKMHARVLHALGEYGLSLSTFFHIQQSSCEFESSSLLEAMFRQALSVGDEKAANKLLESLCGSSSSQVLLLKAFNSMFLGAFPRAQEYIQRMSKGTNGSNDTTLNSAAICLLYSGKVRDAVEIYSKYVQNSSEPLYTNFKAVSELGCSTAEKTVLLNDFIKKGSH